MANTVPGVTRVSREQMAAMLGIGAQALDLTALAAPTVSPRTVTPGLGQARRFSGTTDRVFDASPTGGDSFAAALTKAIDARKGVDRAAPARPARAEARRERAAAVRDVVRQLKQLVDAAREPRDAQSTQALKQADQAVARRQQEHDSKALSGVVERVASASGVTAGAVSTPVESGGAASGEASSPAVEQQAAEALFQTVAEAIAQATTPEGEVDEAALVAALLADPSLLAAAEALIATLQGFVVQATPIALPALDSTGESLAGGTESGRKAASAGQSSVPTAAISVSANEAARDSVTDAPSLTAAAVTAAVTEGLENSESANGSTRMPDLTATTAVSEAEAILAAAAGTSQRVVPEQQPAAESTAAVDPVAQATPIAQLDSEGNRSITVATQIAAEVAIAPEAATAVSLVSPDAGQAEAVLTGSGEEMNGAAPTEVGSATIISQSGDAQADSQPNGRSFSQDGGDPTEALASTVSTVGSVSQSATSLDADGTSAGFSASGTSPSSSATMPASSTPSTGSVAGTGTTAPAVRTDAVSQPQGLPDASPDVDLHAQVSPVIVRQARLIGGNGGHELTVSLNPDHLGPLHVRISLVEGVLSVGLTTTNADARQALENALPQLRGALVESGLKLERLDVSQRDAGQSGGQTGQRGSANAGRGGGEGRNGFTGGGTGGDARQANGGNAGQNGGSSFADVLLDQDGRAFGSPARGARWMGYRAYRRA